MKASIFKINKPAKSSGLKRVFKVFHCESTISQVGDRCGSITETVERTSLRQEQEKGEKQLFNCNKVAMKYIDADDPLIQKLKIESNNKEVPIKTSLGVNFEEKNKFTKIETLASQIIEGNCRMFVVSEYLFAQSEMLKEMNFEEFRNIKEKTCK